MNKKNIPLLTYIILFLGFLNSCSAQKNTELNTAKTTINKVVPKPETKILKKSNLVLPEINREFRAAWIATVVNIN